jgi:Protein of unknown function (DUF2927)
MKSSSVFLLIGILIIAVGIAWIISGGPVLPTQGAAQTPAPATTASGPATTTATPEVTLTIVESITPQAVPTTVVTVTKTAQPTTTVTAVSGDDVRNHFVDIAYTGTNRLELLDQYTARSRISLSAPSASDDDIILIERTAKAFNDASTTVKLSENVKQTDQADILIKFLPENGLKDIDLNTAPDSGPYAAAILTRKELYQGTTPAAKILRGTIYINANLKGDAKKHVIVRSLMYEMGLTGETTKYPDSIFYAQENSNVNFAPIDTKAIAMLYNSGFTNGMGADALRYYLYNP